MEEKDSSPPYVSRRKFLKEAGTVLAYFLTHPLDLFSRPPNSPWFREDPEFGDSLKDLAPFYLSSAKKNRVIIKTPEGILTLIRPSLAYREIYCRDSVLASLGLNFSLLRGTYEWFKGHQHQDTGQIPTAVSLEREVSFKDDESTLLYILLIWKLKKQGEKIDQDSLKRAWKYIESKVEEGKFLSSGPFSYWADNLEIFQPTVVPYNQGLYVLCLEMLTDLGIPITPEEKEKARQEYQKSLGIFPYQDISGLFPEVLARWLLGRGFLPDKVVLEKINDWINNCSVFYSDGGLAGLKTIASKDGNFLPMKNFWEKNLAHPGDYQNGGNWPLWNLAALILAYKISGSQDYSKMIEVLVRHELFDGSSKEYWHLGKGKLGETDEIRKKLFLECFNLSFIKMG